MSGRFAPSPSGPLHLGNLRTALVAWLAARSTGREFLVRIEDLEPATSRRAHADLQLADLAALGLDWDGPPIYQSERLEQYRSMIDELDAAGLVYRCYCTRREIRDEIERSTRAPHSARALPDGAYPGSCRDLSADERAERARTRPAALRLRTEGQLRSFEDVIAGSFVGGVDDLVLARADQVPAYNLAVVVDDHLQGVTQVVRGDDLLTSTPRQILLYEMLGWRPPEYWHVSLVMDGAVRLAKRDGGVTLAELRHSGWTAARVLGALAGSLTLASGREDVSIDRLVERFDPDLIPSTPVDVSAII